ncbi:MAG: sortase [Clostridia bacterium]
MKSKEFFLFLMFLGILCIACVLFITINIQIEEEQAKSFSDEIVINFTENIVCSTSIIPTVTSSIIYENETSLETSLETSIIEIDNQEYIGVLCIPSLNITLPVTSTWNYDLLKKTPCVFSGTIENENLIIAGHNYKSHFAYLKNLSLGDTAYILDANGNFHNYEVILIETIAGDEVSNLLDGEWDLSLFTCTNANNSHRTVLRFQKIDPNI